MGEFSEQISIRPLRENDSVTQLLNVLSYLSPAPYYGHDVYKAIFSYRSTNTITLLAIDSVASIIVGTASVFMERKFSRFGVFAGYLEDVVVLPEYRGRGIAESLVKQIVEHVKNLGCYRVVLSCADELIDFYGKCGFQENGTSMRLSC